MLKPTLLKKSFNVIQRVGKTATVAGLTCLKVAKGEKNGRLFVKRYI